ncbi:NAD(P)-binding protein [Cryphonectria parasitica EP155]|uniref:NAD(P)-binding protein n=1 Tax=Cryphonectria parasitica (strain ATCC 38755 / EP155) TaxID=660469 RepID=A0A9P4XX40_CRYP1|nr:NAD(P)-binding protein [Cryphonectria parasitica EP155]KAF3762952.1 NAD(P)-binding protein [Cryphonectria parasitica EP155]
MAPFSSQETAILLWMTFKLSRAVFCGQHDPGLHVIATARDPSVLTNLAAQASKTVTTFFSELTGGRLDILVNNLCTHTHPALDFSIPDLPATFEVNVFGVMDAVAAFSNLLIESKGLIINITSLSALTPYVIGSAYCASKGAVVSYSRTLRQELRLFGVRVMICMIHRTLPPDSLHNPVNELFEKRLVFSHNNSPVDNEIFSRELTSDALKRISPRVCRTLVEAPESKPFQSP